jgi:RND family efflux transporter MFP subunit
MIRYLPNSSNREISLKQQEAIMKSTVTFGSILFLLATTFVAGRYSGPFRRNDHGTVRRILYYVDPMHPSYRSDRPGIAPDCGMALEPVYEGEDPAVKLQLAVGSVYVSPEKQQLIGLRVEIVARNSGARLIRTTGRVEADDNRVYRLTAGTEGWVQSLENNPSGAIVKRNELLATFYSRELRNAQQAYLGSLTTLDRLRGPNGREMDDAAHGGDANLHINEEQLRSLGMGDSQIKALARTREVTRDITLVSPVDGVVLSRDLSPGQRFDRGTEFYRIADLSKLWIIADIFSDEAQWYRPGTKVRVTVHELGKTLYATVSKFPPLFNPASRTLSLRLEAGNPDLSLSPKMFVDLEFSTPAPRGLSVPEGALLDSGLQKIVYVETRDGVFEPKPVKTGAAYGGRVTITRGLSEGDRVVISGNFLVDSESRMRSPSMVSTLKPAGIRKGESEGAVRDPVYGMSLDRKNRQSKGKIKTYRGESFLFCSDRYLRKFQQHPASYANADLSSSTSPLRKSSLGDD